MHGKIPPARQELIKKISERVRRKRRSAPLDLNKYVQAYYHGVAEEDLAARSLDDLAGAVLWHLDAGATRRPGHSFVRVFNTDAAKDGFNSSHTIVAVINDDMPFLVDSVGSILNQLGLSTHFIAHPVLTVKRDARGHLKSLIEDPAAHTGTRSESWQLFEVDRISDPEQMEALRQRILTVLDDVHWATGDWIEIRKRALAVAAELPANAPGIAGSEISEARALLEWMENNHFTFLGYREYRLERGRSADLLQPIPETGLGLLNPKRERGRKARAIELTGAVRDFAREPSPLIITKANTVSTVHRATYLDYVGIKIVDKSGRVTGERRFIGLWTSSAYNKSPREIPVLRHKVKSVIDHFGLSSSSHDGKAVLHAIETYPRDELFQASTAELIDLVRGIVNLYERQQVKLFVRPDAFQRFYSCMVFVPRDRYNTQVRQRIEKILREEFHATAIESQVQLSDSLLARIHLLVRTIDTKHPANGKPANNTVRIDVPKIERRITAAVRTWTDRLKDALRARHEESTALKLLNKYAGSFPPAYQDDTAETAAVGDIAALEALATDGTGLRISLHRNPEQAPAKLHLRLFRRESPISISDVLPMVENLGLKVISERPYELELTGASPTLSPAAAITPPQTLWIQDFELEHRGGLSLDLARISDDFRDTFSNVWLGNAENDGFNRLVLAAGLSWRQTAVLRAYCRYLLQTGLPFSQAYMEQVLTANAGIGTLLALQFQTLFDPALSAQRRSKELQRIQHELDAALNAVKSLDEDRILRAFATVIAATLRTNYFQLAGDGTDGADHANANVFKPYFSFKFDPAKIPDLPLPRPMFEIFVYSPRVEGVHLRKGRVARGGLRWSDRREDFRTEVLGLMKAQNVKNTVIVPVGAKGGFVPKRLPAGGTRDEIQREVISCYQTFIRALLDITDNIVNGKIVPPPNTERRDEDDPYLVVAADKGTATFSDIANAISAEYNFWLGDAFASGGSVGYDHKKMAITARGGWECVKRHFRELGIDTQAQDFTVAGIGDMAGDVFGNGMLQSPHLRLVAAFNHQHIFFDPEPDAAATCKERERLFNLPRSSWEDYNRKLISKGGGIYSRADKSIALSPQVQALLELRAPSAAPNEVIRAILKMQVDLLWNGGIGTYVKSSRETHADIGDRSNDALRVNGGELRCRVIGEGGNLGFSQLGRVEYALHGGKLNTDFIDNSAGVNCSDVEVNIKILLNALMQSGKLTFADRNALLAQMTDEVAELVLRNNYLQGQAISTLQTQATERFSEHVHLIRVLTQSGDLDPAIEYLPDEDSIAERRKNKQGLTRPELAIVLAYSKIWLFNQLVHSDVPEDPYLSQELDRYFPAPIRKRYGKYLDSHRLKREIIVTATTNSLVNRMGPVFALRTQEDTGAEPAAIARAYSIAREIFDMRALWTAIEALDNRVPAETQYEMMYQTSRLLRHMTYWFLNYHERELDIDSAVKRFAPDVRELSQSLGEVLVGSDLKRYAEAKNQLTAARVPEKIAVRLAALNAMHSALDIVEVAQEAKLGVEYTGQVYFMLGEQLNLSWMREQIETLSVDGHWQAVARGTLRDNLYTLQRQLTSKVLSRKPGKDPATTVFNWLAARKLQLDHIQRTISDMRSGIATDFPTLSVALQAVRRLAEN